jgi:hypothetical protein
MSEIADLLERFRRGPEVLAMVLTGFTRMQADKHPWGKQGSIGVNLRASAVSMFWS